MKKAKKKVRRRILIVLCLIFIGIASLVFAVAVIAAYVIQPDYAYDYAPDYWKTFSEFGDLFTTTK